MQQQKSQRLFWSLSQPFRLFGMTIDEWALVLGGVIPGIVLVNDDGLMFGMGLMIGGCFSCYAVKKFKKLSEYFLLKSWLLSKGLTAAPSKGYPHMLNQRVGK